MWNRAFDFDREMLGSKVYQRQFRSLIRGAFRKRRKSDCTERSATINPRTMGKEDERTNPYKKEASGLVLLVGPDKRGKVMLLNSLQWYHDLIQYSKRQKLYRTRIVARTCQEFHIMLSTLQSDIDLFDFEEIRKEVQLVLGYGLFFEPSRVSAELLSAIRVLSKHYVVKQRLPSSQFYGGQSSTN